LLSLLVYVMPVTGKGFDQCYNAQAAVDTDTLLTAWQGYPEALGQPTCRLADTGDFSAANVQACHAHGIEPLLAMKLDVHHPPVFKRSTRCANIRWNRSWGSSST
jgi:hypothetical protein